MTVSQDNDVTFDSGHIAPSTNSDNRTINGTGNGVADAITNGATDAKTNGHTSGLDNSFPHVRAARRIAICGIGLRLPGGIRNTDAFWELLVNGKDARGPIPSSRYNIEGFDASLGGKGAIKTRHGYFLDEDVSSFDASFFSMSRNELEKCDPQQRQLLEVTRECLEDAGEVNYRGRPVGCYVGTFGEDWLQMSARETQHSGGYMVGQLDIMLANRVSYEYDFRGPSMVIKTGCSASLIALHEACRALQNGDATGAVVAGTSLIMAPTTTSAMTSEGILSPEGSCKTFDAKADGFARAESITAIYLKPLEDAIRDGNPIRAVISGSGTNSDGKSASLMSPNGKAQEELIRKVYASAGLDPRETSFVECHGTGTPTGDPIETTAVGNVFGSDGVYIGSVKPNIGHSEGSSGITSIIKTVLALEHKIIPPNIKLQTPNPAIPFAECNLKVPLVPTAFPPDRAERVSINSFGIGGANAHVIVESFQQQRTAQSGRVKNVESYQKPELLLFSANTRPSLQEQIRLYREFVGLHPELSVDIAYTRALAREKLSHRAYAILENGDFTEVSNAVKVPANAPPVNVIFSGQGAQWPEMGKDLIRTDLQFREDIAKMDRILQGLRHPPSWTIMDELQRPSGTSQLHKAELAQPLSTALQIALFNRFATLGLRPAAVVGHSSGEIAAAYAAGGLSLKQAIIISYYRGYVTAKQTLNGAMAAIGLGEIDVAPYLETIQGVVVACENSPSSTTISGDSKQVDKVIAAIKEAAPEILARKLKVDMAYHSHHMISFGREYRRLVEHDLEFSGTQQGEPLTADFFSSVTGNVISDSSKFSPSYWETNLTSSVRFSSAIASLLSLGGDDGLFLEIGPHSTLGGPLRQICAANSKPCNYVASMARGTDSAVTLLSAVGKLYQQGLRLDFAPLVPHGKIIPGLPTYPWDYSGSYWYESRLSNAWRMRKYGHHSILGTRSPETADTEPQWRNVLYLEDEPWIADHKVNEDIVFPFAGYVAMAGEAARQTVNGDAGAGYRLRHVVAHSALLIKETEPAEIVTSLRRLKLTDSEDAKWFDFSIASFSGSGWVKHCDGQVTVVGAPPPSSWTPEKLARDVDISRFYETMGKIGLVYGPEFQTLADVTASPTEWIAGGRIYDPNDHRHGPFTLHPAAIDASLQLLIVAKAQGLGRNFCSLALPTKIEHLEIYRGADIMYIKAECPNNSLESGVVECIADGNVGLRISGLQVKPLEDEKSAETTTNVHAAARLQWLPDFDFADVSKLFIPPKSDRVVKRVLEEMTLLCILEAADKVEGLTPCQPHFEKFRNWLHMQIDRAKAGEYTLVEKDCQNYVKLPREERLAMVEDRYQELLLTDGAPLAVGVKRTCDNADRIFTGKADVLDVLMEGDALAKIYDTVSFGHSDFVRLLSQTRPNLRILEVGAGTGGTTELIIRDLATEDAFPAYSSYMFTDISAGFFPQAKERFAYASNMDFKVFDITKDSFEQGFKESSYDLILAPNVIHATACLKESLGHLQPLLKPDGMLVMTELCAVTRTANLIFGNFPGWWLGDADDRPYEPYVPVARWDTELKAAGFTGVEVAVCDDEHPYQVLAAIMSKRRIPSTPKERKVTILCSYPDQGVPQSLTASLSKLGWDVTHCKLGSPPPEDRDIICCLDMESNFFEDMTTERFSAFQSLLRSLKTQIFLWLTSLVQINCKDPRSAQTLGVTRTIRSELSLPFYTLEIDKNENNFTGLVTDVFNKVRKETDADNLSSDKEFAVDNGVICIGRYQPFSLPKELRTRSSALSAPPSKAKVLEIEKPGSLESMYWRDELVPEALPAGHVEIDPRAAGLNYKDILMSLGVVRSESAHTNLGFEVSGIVRRVGPGVRGLAEGDRVFALATRGCIATKVVISAALMAKIPDSLSYEDAAAVPACFVTAIYSLIYVGRLEEGQSVLIHSACGGVGLAAIQVCKMMKAEIFATVSSEQKIEHLINIGIPRNRIFHSRDASFFSGIMRETAGTGVDIVLNSLSGELLHESWRCVAEYGTMIELSKRDLEGSGRLDLRPFLANRSYCCIDIGQFAKERPEKMKAILERYVELYQSGSLHPLEPVVCFDAAIAEHAFRHLQNPDHIGKVVVKIPEDSSDIETSAELQPLQFRSDATYLLVGGVGGLGRSLATWLVERGARYLTLLSRSAGISEQSKSLVKELESMGCSVEAVAGDVSNMQDVNRALLISERPIKGVLQLAMVLADNNLLEMTWNDWMTATKPKVHGTWNLHRGLLDEPLDFFWLASSMVTAMDQPGQGNYSAANTFLEAFCQYRHSLSLPASVLNICPIEGVGFVAGNAVARRNVKSQGMYCLSEREFLDCVELCISASSPDMNNPLAPSSAPPTAWSSTGQIFVGLHSEIHLDDPRNRTNWRHDRRMGTYHNVRVEETVRELSALKQFLNELADSDDVEATLAKPATVEFVARETGRRIHDLMLKPDEEVDISLSLAKIGLDSLMAIELRRWFRQAFGLQISVLEIMRSESLAQLGQFVVDKLKGKFRSKTGPN